MKTITKICKCGKKFLYKIKGEGIYGSNLKTCNECRRYAHPRVIDIDTIEAKRGHLQAFFGDYEDQLV